MSAPFEPDLSVSVGGLSLKNPIIAASGAFGYGLEMAPLCPPERLGAVIVKGLSWEPWPGNSGHRVCEAAGGLINSIGLQNIGARAFVGDKLPALKATGAVVGAGVVGRTAEEYLKSAEILAKSDIDFLELNISCPNLASEGGLSFGADPGAASDLAGRVKEAVAKYAKPLWVKLPPLVADIALLAAKVAAAGADAVSLINTLPAMAIDLESRRPLLGNVTGGLSGPPIKPVALRQVMLAAKAAGVPVVGLGGIMDGRDALEFMVAGAAAVQMGTAILADPAAPLAAIEGIRRYLLDHGISSAASMIGTLEAAPKSAACGFQGGSRG